MAFSVAVTGHIEAHTGGRVYSFDNLVLDSGWADLLQKMNGADGDMVPQWLYFGTGDTEPQATETDLEARVASTKKAATSVTYGGQTDAGNLRAYSQAMVRFDYAVGEMTGKWSELGLSYDEDGFQFYNRALVRDQNEIPVPLIVLSDQSLTVYVRLRLYLQGWGETINMGDRTGTIAMLGNIANSSTGLWQKGLPIFGAKMAGISGMASGVDLSEPSAFQYISTAPDTAFTATKITLQGRDGADMMDIQIDPDLEKVQGTSLQYRFRVAFSRT